MNLLSILMMMQQPGQKNNPLVSLLPFIIILVIIYFFMIRPQSKKAKQQRMFKDTLKKGDKVITIGGIHGRIAEIKDNSFIIDAGNNVKLTIQKDAVSMDATVANQDKKDE